MADEMLTGFLAGQADSNNNCNRGGWGNGWGGGLGDLIGLAIVGMLFGGGGWGGFGGFGGGGTAVNGALTRAELYDGFAIQNIDNAVRGVQQGICDSTYALNNTINNGFSSAQMTAMQGFHGVDNAICNLGFNMQQGFNTLGFQQKDCCCETQRLIERGFCDLGNAINMQTRDIIDNNNCNYRGLMDFLVQEKLSSKDAQIAQLQNRVSQLDQNSVIRAAIDASTAEIIRRTGNECPVPAYVVPNPNCCYGNPLGVGYGYNGYGNYSGNGCGCGC